MIAMVEATAGAKAAEACNRLAMVELIARGVLGGFRLTPEVSALRDAALDRILAEVATPRKRFHRHGNDLFAKDFALCRGKLLPCGVEFVDMYSGVPRRLLASGGMRQLAGTLGFFARMGGFRPVFELHFDRRLVGAFDSAGYAALYLRIAGLMALNPHVRGVVSSSWWHDPQLGRISPELGFIGQYPEGAGARLFRIGENATATTDATRFAARRMELYKGGAYRPCVYTMIWARRDVLAWAQNYRGGP
ncbi:MAG TPA: hypothetical protein VGE05_09040 [Novosphingobium sp.]